MAFDDAPNIFFDNVVDLRGLPMKAVSFKFYDHLYHVEYLCCAGLDFPAFKKKCDKFMGKSDVEEGGCTAKTVVHIKECKVAFYFKHHTPSNCLVAHESFHALHAVTFGKGLKLDDSSEEAYAYLLGWIVNQIGKGVNTKNVKYIGKI